MMRSTAVNDEKRKKGHGWKLVNYADNYVEYLYVSKFIFH